MADTITTLTTLTTPVTIGKVIKIKASRLLTTSYCGAGRKENSFQLTGEEMIERGYAQEVFT